MFFAGLFWGYIQALHLDDLAPRRLERCVSCSVPTKKVSVGVTRAVCEGLACPQERHRENLKGKQSGVVDLERILAKAHKICVSVSPSFLLGDL